VRTKKDVPDIRAHPKQLAHNRVLVAENELNHRKSKFNGHGTVNIDSVTHVSIATEAVVEVVILARRHVS
jgi:hypothetical protein